MTDDRAPRYLYGVVRTGSFGDSMPGLDAARVSELAAGPVAALVSPMQTGDPAPTRDRLRAHLDVLRAAGERTTVVPMRFGMVTNPDRLRSELLEPRRKELLALLRELDGRVEVDVKASFREDAMLAEIVREEPAIRRLDARIRSRPGDASYYDRVRLGELVVAAMRVRAEREGRDLLRRLSRAAARAVAGPPSGERAVLDAAFLVDRSALDEFDEVVARIEAERGDRLRVRAVGPLPPSSFAALDPPRRRRR
jgi:hypothetical protein